MRVRAEEIEKSLESERQRADDTERRLREREREILEMRMIFDNEKHERELRIQGLVRDAEEKECMITTLEREKRELEQRNVSLRMEVKEREERVQGLKKKVKAKKSEIAALKRERDEKGKKEDAVEDAVDPSAKVCLDMLLALCYCLLMSQLCYSPSDRILSIQKFPKSTPICTKNTSPPHTHPHILRMFSAT